MLLLLLWLVDGERRLAMECERWLADGERWLADGKRWRR
jgi:hypothetical protein